MMAAMPIDMFIEPDADPRVEPPSTGDERATSGTPTCCASASTAGWASSGRQ